MKVVQVGKYYDPYRGGMETVLKALCEQLKLELDIHVLVSNTAPRTVHEKRDFTVTRLASWGTFQSSSITPTLPSWIWNIRADLFHVHLPNPLAEFSCLVAARDKPVIAHFHSDIVKQKTLLKIYAPLLERFYARASCIIVPTPNHISISPFVSRFREKCYVVPYGIVVERFDLDAALRTKVNRLRRDWPVILFTGRLVYYKGLHYLIEAMQGVAAELWIAGTGILEPALRALCARLGVAEKVRFLGELAEEDLPAYYHAADVFVLPSVEYSEMFGIVLLEAMACRKPLVCTNIPTGVSWVNQHNVTGLCVPPRDARALCQAINALLASNTLRAEMGQAGRERVEREFTSVRMAQTITELYQHVVG